MELIYNSWEVNNYSQDKKSLIKLYLEKIKKALIESRTNENESN